MRRESITRNYKQEFDDMKAWGIQSSVDIHHCDPNLIRDADAIKEFVIQLCELIEMRRFGDPVIVHFGENERVAGFSMTQLIETSLISAHFANQSNNVYLDIFSCKYYEPETAVQFAKNYFKGTDYNLTVVLRK
jgi:S-adenosylmethionine/arginine decarboxylase-like enzyme